MTAKTSPRLDNGHAFLSPAPSRVTLPFFSAQYARDSNHQGEHVGVLRVLFLRLMFSPEFHFLGAARGEKRLLLLLLLRLFPTLIERHAAAAVEVALSLHSIIFFLSQSAPPPSPLFRPCRARGHDDIFIGLERKRGEKRVFNRLRGWGKLRVQGF